jgi:hypothetical protein
MVGAACLTVGACASAVAATAVDYVPYSASFLRVSALPLPVGAQTYSVAVDADSGIAVDEVKLVGLERVPADGDLQVTLRARPAAITEATLQHFDGHVSNTVNGQAAPPVFQYTIWWSDVVVQQEAEVGVSTRGGEQLKSSGPIGAAWRGSFGKPEKIATGLLQMCDGPRCVMENEPVTSPDAATQRLDFLVQTFATDVSLDGQPLASGGRARAEQFLTQAREQLRTKPANAYSARTLQRVNAWLESHFGSGARTATLSLATGPSDPRFAALINGLGDGTAPEAGARRDEALRGLRALAADGALKPRLRAAAMYDCAALEGVAGQREQATNDLAAAEEENAREKDGFLGTKHGAALDQKIGTLRQWLEARGPAPP